MWRSGIVALLTALAGTASVEPVIAQGRAQASTTATGAWEAAYGVSLVGLPIGQATVNAALDPGRYKVEIQARLTGLAGMITGGRGAGQASGVLSALGRPSSAGYSASGSNGKESRTVRMAMAAGTATAIDISPPIERKPDHIPLSDEHRRGVVDPVTALLMPVAPGEDPISQAACNRRIPVFDGNARYDIELAFAGIQTVQGRGYSGPVAVCNARFTPIAGHRPNRSARYMAENRDMQVWLAPISGTNLVAPYRIAVRSEIGMVVIEATRFRGPAPASSQATSSIARPARAAQPN